MLAVRQALLFSFQTSLSHAIVFYGSFDFVEIAFAHFVCKQVYPHSLTRNFQP